MAEKLFLKILNLLRKTYLLLAILCVIYIASINLPEISEAIHYANTIDLKTYISVLVLSFFSYFFRSVRWLVYIRKIEHKEASYHHTLIYLSGFAFTVSPGKSGELMRGTHLNRLGIPFSYTFASFVSERLLDVIIVSSIGVYSIVIITENNLYGLIAPALLTIPFLFKPLLSTSWFLEFIKKKNNIHSLIIYSQSLWQPRVTLITIALSIMAWCAQGMALFLFITSLGCDISLLKAVSIYCLSLLIGAASLIPGGLGATEIGMVWLLTQVGISPEIALIAAMFTRTLTLWPAMFTGIVCSAMLARSYYSGQAQPDT